MEGLDPMAIYAITLSAILAISLIANVVSYFDIRNLRRAAAIYERQLTTLRQKMRQLPPASRLLHGMPASKLTLITNKKSIQVINKLLTPRKDK